MALFFENQACFIGCFHPPFSSISSHKIYAKYFTEKCTVSKEQKSRNSIPTFSYI